MKEIALSRCPKNPLRPLLETEHQYLRQLSRSQVAPAIQVARANALLAVADGSGYTKAAQMAGRRSGDAIAALVTRFNREGIAAVAPRHGGGQPRRYSALEREQILAEARRVPDRAQDGTAVWSLTTLRRALRKQHFPQISRATIHHILVEAGLTWQENRSWCETGTARRQRKCHGQTVVVKVADPDAAAKKN